MKRIKEFVMREIADETVLIPTGETAQEFNGIISMTEVAAFIWNHIEEAENFMELVKMITDEYEVEAQVAAQDAVEFITHMLSQRMVAVTDDQKGW